MSLKLKAITPLAEPHKAAQESPKIVSVKDSKGEIPLAGRPMMIM